MDRMPDGVEAAPGDLSPPAQTPEDLPAGGEGGTPLLTLTGFHGPLDHLLALARAQTIDLAAMSLTALLDQLAAALQQAPASVPLGRKGDWVVMTAWLVQLRTRLLLPMDAPAHADATAEAGQLRDRLIALQATQALAGWLERRPQLGRDVFARGHPPSRAQSQAPELFGVSGEPGVGVDVIAFLWSSMALFDDDPLPETVNVYRPPRPQLYDPAEARERILQRLAEAPEGGTLECFLPEMPDTGEADARARVRRRLAWSSTFVASLELARDGGVVLQQEKRFTAIYVSLTTGRTNELELGFDLEDAEPAPQRQRQPDRRNQTALEHRSGH